MAGSAARERERSDSLVAGVLLSIRHVRKKTAANPSVWEHRSGAE